MINRDYKGFNRSKPLFSRKKSRRKGAIVTISALSVVFAAVSYLAMTPGEESSTQEKQQEILTLQLSTDDNNSTANSANLDTESNSLPLTDGVLEPAKQKLSTNEQAHSKNPQNSQDLEQATTAIKEFVKKTTKPKYDWQTVKVAKGESLSRIFNKLGFSSKDLHYIMQSDDQVDILKKIRPGHTLEFAANENKGFQELRYPFNSSDTLVITKLADKEFDVSLDKKPIEFKQRFATATITSSFYNAGKQAGLPDGVIMELAGVFEYDIDFALEIRKNDSFSVLYEEKYIDGKKAGYGNILSAEFYNMGEHYAAVRYTDTNGRTAYYTPEGKALRKSFLRAPLKFNYVSSNFNPKRFHPIQKRVKAHRGTDYRAPIGTPVRAAGDGRVVKSAYNRFNGNYVFIQHGGNITTKYLHFSKRAVKAGQRVKQGQIIGYVGSTGMSQAPHLHYEFVVNGVHRNPRTVKLPHAAPVPKAEMARFQEHSKPLVARLETERTTYFARLNDEKSAGSASNSKLQK
ncbi:peptidoglycan DD-metalloendopeptidase family protein [Kangiella spongicola]|uniref:Peptidase M23 n=1 Tax=Kangiella spongicola TaxID=796379 RepID=A0A318D6Z0_9GAMM|nr:peptidoglycan DD-metalloendopeptidase family protein [Kangiella spongicola]PXF64611.1 peptidase M23 [Kangiella spongicola]